MTPVLIGFLAFSGSAIIGLIGGVAQPAVHDEFSYLLAADTFAHGRLANPTHPTWIHFESIHIIHQPTYMSKYPPGQGAILALGQLLSGYPIIGVWLSMGLMCSAISWMLQAWVPPRWALIGGLFSVLNPYVGIGSYWGQSYWGGAVAATGGALVLGGVRSLIKEPQVHRALLTGIGLLILSSSRPYEGFLLSVCAGVALLQGLIRKSKIERTILVRKIIGPLVLTSIVTGAWTAYYNFRVTGNMFRLPYQVHESAYSIAPTFVWQKTSPAPQYRHARLEEFHKLYELSLYKEKRSWIGFAKMNLNASLSYFFLCSNIMLIPMIVNFRGLARWTLRNQWARVAFMIYLVATVGLMVTTFSALHYWAPIVTLYYYFGIQAIRLWIWRDRQLKPFIVPVIFGLMLILLIVTTWRRIVEDTNSLAPQMQRASLLANLEQQPGQHIVLVKYGPAQSGDHEWVYNKADIDQAKVVWAHDMGLRENCELAEYFKNSTIWSLTIERDDAPVKVLPFSRQSCFLRHRDEQKFSHKSKSPPIVSTPHDRTLSVRTGSS